MQDIVATMYRLVVDDVIHRLSRILRELFMGRHNSDLNSNHTLSIDQVRMKHRDRVLRINGVVGIGIGEDHGRPVIHVLIRERTTTLEREIPKDLDGYPVRLVVSGNIIAAV
jgi:hypothetical protein